MAQKYIFQEDPVVIKNAAEADPQEIGEALADIAAKNGGELTEEAVIAAARDPRSVLHKHFEWDDRVAAHAYRKHRTTERH
jgi:hypothetical protein